MISLMFMVGVIGLLFVMAYAANRRFGVLGMALAAGSLLSTHFSGIVTPILLQQGIVSVAPPLSLVVATTLLLLPPVLLLFNGPSYTVPWQRIVGPLAFAVMGFALLIGPLAMTLQLDGVGLALISFVQKNASIVIVIGILTAVGDMLLTGWSKSKKREH